MSSAKIPDPKVFYTEQIPAQFNQIFDAQKQLGHAGHKVFEGMRAVNATIRVDILDANESFFLNIDSGRMQAGESPSHPPFITLRKNRAAYERLIRESVDSEMSLLGGLSGLTDEIKLTQQRIDSLSAVNGLLKLEITGANGFELFTHFGSDLIPDEPSTSITIDEDAYLGLRSGELSPTDAFMNGRIQIEGDMQMAMALALAAISAD